MSTTPNLDDALHELAEACDWDGNENAAYMSGIFMGLQLAQQGDAINVMDVLDELSWELLYAIDDDDNQYDQLQELRSKHGLAPYDPDNPHR